MHSCFSPSRTPDDEEEKMAHTRPAESAGADLDDSVGRVKPATPTTNLLTNHAVVHTYDTYVCRSLQQSRER